MLVLSLLLVATISMADPSREALKSEATGFHQALAADFDVGASLDWHFQLDAVPEESVGDLIDALGRAGFASIEVVDGDTDGGYSVACSETRTHDAQSFAARVQGVVELARQYGGTLADYSAGP